MHPNDPSHGLIPVSAEKRLSENQSKVSFRENYLPLQSSRCQRPHASVSESRKKKGAAETPSALLFLSSHFRYWAIWSSVKVSEANSLPHIGPSRSFCTSQAVQRNCCPELRVSVPLAYLKRCRVRALTNDKLFHIALYILNHGQLYITLLQFAFSASWCVCESDPCW